MLKGKNAIITGARRGIGRATIEVFAENGANIWACARKKDADFETDINVLSEKYGVSIWPVYFDLTDDDQMKAAIQGIRRTKLPVDLLVNIAAIADESSSFTMSAIDKIKNTFEVNFFALTRLTQYVARIMIHQGSGNIVNITSVAGIDGTPGQYEYVGSKAAVIGGTKELARELGQYNIRVNAVAPGIVDTDMGAQIREDLKKATLEKVIMKRLGRPEEIANVIAFLASSKASFITGQILRVDGGM